MIQPTFRKDRSTNTSSSDIWIVFPNEQPRRIGNEKLRYRNNELRGPDDGCLWLLMRLSETGNDLMLLTCMARIGAPFFCIYNTRNRWNGTRWIRAVKWREQGPCWLFLLLTALLDWAVNPSDASSTISYLPTPFSPPFRLQPKRFLGRTFTTHGTYI